MVKNLPAMQETQVRSLGGKISWRKEWQPLQYSFLEKLMDRGTWQATVHEVAEADMTERLHFPFSLSCIGEGNGNPLQCSYLENLRDGGAGGLPSMGLHRAGHD